MTSERGTLTREGKAYTLRFERLLPHPPEKVWRGLTEKDELAHWFPAAIEGAREAGARLTFVFPPEPGQVPADTTETGAEMSGEMKVYDPPRLLEFTWGEESMRFELEARDGGTRLVFINTFSDVKKSARDATGWDFCIGNLERRLAGDAGEAFTNAKFDPVFDEYAATFGPEASSKKNPEMG